MATRSWAFRPLSPEALLQDSAEWANVLNTFVIITDEGLDISANTGNIGTITVGVLQGAELTIDLNATGTDPVLLHDSFSLNADGSASFAGDLDAVNGTFGTITAGRLQGDTLLIDLDATGTDPVLQHQNFALLADGTAIFGGDLSGAGGTFSGDLSSVGGTFSGELSGATGSFAGGVTVNWGSGIDFDGDPNVPDSGIAASGDFSMSSLAMTHGSASCALIREVVSVIPLEIAYYFATDAIRCTTGAIDHLTITTLNSQNLGFGANDSGGAGYRLVLVPNA